MDALARSGIVQVAAPRPVAPDLGGDVADDGAHRDRIFYGEEGIRGGRDTDGGQGVSLKVAVVGGGSTYTPELADGFPRLRDLLAVDELMLIDPAAERLETVGRFCARLFAH